MKSKLHQAHCDFHPLRHTQKPKGGRTMNHPFMLYVNRKLTSREKLDKYLEMTTDLIIYIGRSDRYDQIECNVFLRRPHRGRKTQRHRLKVSAVSSELNSGSNGNMFPCTQTLLGNKLWEKTFYLRLKI